MKASAFVLWQTLVPWLRPQGLQAHEPLDPVQTAFDAVRQQFSLDPPCSVGSIADKELAFTCWPTVASLRDLALGDRFSQAWKPDRDTPIVLHSDATVLRNEDELHVASFAKEAAAFLKMSRSAFSLVTSRLSRSISCCSGFIYPWPGKA